MKTAVTILALLVPMLGFGASQIYAPLNTPVVSAIDVLNGSQAVFSAVGHYGTSVFVSPDGESLFVPASNSTIASFDIKSGKQIKIYKTTYPPFSDFLGEVPIAISPDGSILLVGTCASHADVVCQKGFVEMLNVSSGAEIGLVGFGNDQVSGIAVAPDAATAYVSHFYEFDCGFSCDADSAVRTVPSNALTALSLPSLKLGNSVTFSFAPGALVVAASGTVAYVGAADGLAEVSLPELKITNQIVDLLAPRLALSANGTLLTVGQPAYNTQNPTDSVTFYRVPGLTLIGTVALPSYIGIGLAADPRGRFAYTGYSDAVYQVDSESLTVSKTIATGDVLDLAISKGGGILYPLLNPGSSLATFEEGATEPTHISVLQETSTLTFSNNGQVLYTSPWFPQSGIVPFSTTSGTKLGTYIPNNSSISTALSPDGSTLYSVAESSLGGPPFNLFILNAQTGAVKATVPLAGSPGEVAVTPDGGKVVVNVVTGPIIYNVSNGTVTTVAMTGGCVPGGAIAFSPTETLAFASGLNGDIAVIDTTTGAIMSTVATNVFYPQAFGVTADGQYLYATAAAGEANPGVVIQINTLDIVGSLPAAGPLAVR